MRRMVMAMGVGMVLATAAHAFEDEMMGTRVNGRMERRDEGFDRVNDPKMDYHGEHDLAPRKLRGDASKSPAKPAADAVPPTADGPPIRPE